VASLADDVAWPVEVDGLVLRLATLDDVEATWRYRQLASVSQWLTSGPATFDEYRARYSNPAWLDRTVVLERDDEVIGDLMLGIEDAWSQTEISEQAVGVHGNLGWVLDPAHEGHGYATTAVRELIRIAFDDLGLRRVTADCFAANEPSWRLMERVGMRREAHTVRDALHRSGDWLDGLAYALLADEWRATR